MMRRTRVAAIRQLDELLAGTLAPDDSSAAALDLLPIAAGIGLDESAHLAAGSLALGRSQLLAAIASLPQQQPAAVNLPGWLRTPALAGGLAAALSGGAIAYAAQGAAPDSLLYPVQQAVQAVSQGVPFLPQPTPTATPSPTATVAPAATQAIQVPAALPRGSEPARRAAAVTPTAAAISSAPGRGADRGQGNLDGDKKRGDGDGGGAAIGGGATDQRGDGANSQVGGSDANQRGGSNDQRGGRQNDQARASNTPNSGDRSGDNENGRPGDRSARFNRGD